MNHLDLLFPAITVACFAVIAVVAHRAGSGDPARNPLERRR